MTTLSQTNTSILNTLVTGPDGHAVYEVFGGSTTTILRHGTVIASIEWHALGSDSLAFEGREGLMKDLFPRTGTFSKSRTYITRNGMSFKWKGRRELYCVTADSGMNLATYNRVSLAPFRSKKSALYVNNVGVEIMDALVVTWIIMEKYARDSRKRAARAGAAGAGGGGVYEFSAEQSSVDWTYLVSLLLMACNAAVSSAITCGQIPLTITAPQRLELNSSYGLKNAVSPQVLPHKALGLFKVAAKFPVPRLMPTLVQTKSTILNTLVTGPDGEILYQISTSSKFFSGSVTTVSRVGAVIATIEWHEFGTPNLTFEGRIGPLKELFPKSRHVLSKSRIYTTQSGVRFKWKHGGKLYCISTETGLNLATYYRVHFAYLWDKRSTLDIVEGNEALMDALVALLAGYILKGLHPRVSAANELSSAGDGNPYPLPELTYQHSLSYSDGKVAYVVDTELKLKERVTSIKLASGEELARIKWKSFTFEEEVVTMKGESVLLSELMPHAGKAMSSDRKFKTSTGRELQWNIDGKLYCTDVETGACVATFYRSSWGIIGSKEPAYIDIGEEVVGEQDLIVATCLIMENLRRHREAILYNGGGWYFAFRPP
ncbi:hypothetical protein FRC12_005285 [Ceratobasidium sp. 428]|nr:hypothetical protein FRC12_005285 [Ceratobasidium sp. 428]